MATEQRNTTSPLIAHLGYVPARGDVVTTPGGGTGKYVGTTATGLDWLVYEDPEREFPVACAAFDVDRMVRRGAHLDA